MGGPESQFGSMICITAAIKGIQEHTSLTRIMLTAAFGRPSLHKISVPADGLQEPVPAVWLLSLHCLHIAGTFPAPGPPHCSGDRTHWRLQGCPPGQASQVIAHLSRTAISLRFYTLIPPPPPGHGGTTAGQIYRQRSSAPQSVCEQAATGVLGVIIRYLLFQI